MELSVISKLCQHENCLQKRWQPRSAIPMLFVSQKWYNEQTQWTDDIEHWNAHITDTTPSVSSQLPSLDTYTDSFARQIISDSPDKTGLRSVKNAYLKKNKNKDTSDKSSQRRYHVMIPIVFTSVFFPSFCFLLTWLTKWCITRWWICCCCCCCWTYYYR